MTSLRMDARRVLVARRERAASSPAPLAAPLVGTAAIMVVAVAVLLLVGAALPVVFGVVVVIGLAAAVAARRTTLSLLSGVTLWLIRPYHSGERVLLHLPERGHSSTDLIDAEIVRIGLLNTTLDTGDGPLKVANARLLVPTYVD